jgi:hypothetical protein
MVTEFVSNSIYESAKSSEAEFGLESLPEDEELSFFKDTGPLSWDDLPKQASYSYYVHESSSGEVDWNNNTLAIDTEAEVEVEAEVEAEVDHQVEAEATHHQTGWSTRLKLSVMRVTGYGEGIESYVPLLNSPQHKKDMAQVFNTSSSSSSASSGLGSGLDSDYQTTITNNNSNVIVTSGIFASMRRWFK